MIRSFIFLALAFLLIGCEEKQEKSDAYGNFEVSSTLISSEASGKLLFFDVEEGEILEQGEFVGLVDTSLLALQRKQLKAKLATLPKKLRNSDADIEVLKNRKEILEYEYQRIERLLKKDLANQKQLDDISGQIEIMDKQILAIQSQTSQTNESIIIERKPLLAQMDILNEQIRRAYIYNPLKGRVLTKIAQQYELVGPGAPLYRIAQMDSLDLKFYVDAVQLQALYLGQEVDVLIDDGESKFLRLKGKVFWIAEEAEFTPKTIQTKEDRVNLVYAVKAKVVNNNGRLKIGMPAEIEFIPNEEVAVQ